MHIQKCNINYETTFFYTFDSDTVFVLDSINHVDP